MMKMLSLIDAASMQQIPEQMRDFAVQAVSGKSDF